MSLIIPYLYSVNLLPAPSDNKGQSIDHSHPEYADARLIVQKTFPQTAYRLAHFDQQEPVDAWPLPGAIAKKSSRPAAAVGKIKTTGAARSAIRPFERSSARFRLLQRRITQRNNPPLAENESATSPRKNNNKESLMSGRSFSRETGNSKRFLPDGKSTTTVQPKKEGEGVIRSLAHDNSTLPSTVATSLGESVDTDVKKIPFKERKARRLSAPTCLRFYNVDVIQLQIEKARYKPLDVRVCVPINTVPLFEYLFTRLLSEPGQKGKEMMICMPVNEVTPQEVKKMHFSKTRGIGQLINGTSTEQEALGNDRIYSILTLSIVPHQKLTLEKVSGNEILPQNSFKIVRHREPDGEERLFIAYFCHQLKNDSGINAGFHEIKNQWGQFIIEDKQTGYAFSSADLGDFAAGLERLSGLRFRPDANIQPLLSINSTASAATERDFSRGRNLFIRREAALRTTPPFGEINIDGSLSFFSPIAFNDPVSKKSHLLYRNCFRVEGNHLRYADERGVTGTLQFSLTRGGTFQRLIWPPSNERNFLLTLGAIAGRTYTLQGVLSLLENNNMTLLNPHPPQHRIQYSPGFYVEAGEIESDVTESNDVMLAGDEHVSAWCGSCFSFNNNQLQFSDHLANQGTLRFSATADKLQIAVRNTPGATVFAHEYGLNANQTYTLNEIQDRLYAQGMVQIPHDRMKM